MKERDLHLHLRLAAGVLLLDDLSHTNYGTPTVYATDRPSLIILVCIGGGSQIRTGDLRAYETGKLTAANIPPSNS